MQLGLGLAALVDLVLQGLVQLLQLVGAAGQARVQVLGADQASLLNQLFGGANYSAGDLIDQVDIEGDSATAGGGRIEVGLSFVFAPTTFASSSDVGAFNPAVASDSLFFIFEEDINGTDLYSGLGPATVAAVPWPASVWLMGAGLAVVGGAVRRQRVSG